MDSEFIAIIAAPPCSTYSISRFIGDPRAADGGAPVVRTRREPSGLLSPSKGHRRELDAANALTKRTVMLLAAAQQVGTQWVLENPADRGDPNDAKLFINADHAPLWITPEILALRKACNAGFATFPMCAFGAPWQKYTSLMFSAGFDTFLAPLSQLMCDHDRHELPAGGKHDKGAWRSPAAAAYPPNFNYFLARAVLSLRVLEYPLMSGYVH